MFKCYIEKCVKEIFAFDCYCGLCEEHFNQIKLFDLW